MGLKDNNDYIKNIYSRKSFGEMKTYLHSPNSRLGNAAIDEYGQTAVQSEKAIRLDGFLDAIRNTVELFAST